MATCLFLFSFSTDKKGYQVGDDVADPSDDSVAPTGILNFAADSLKDSGITSLHLGTDPKLNASQPALPIIFSEDVDLSLGVIRSFSQGLY